MGTKKQVAANRRNSQDSKGPVTPEGKIVSSANSTKHGLLARNAIVLPTEDPSALDQLRENMRAQLQPAGELEEALVERMVVALWKLQRLGVLETGVLTSEYCELMEKQANERASSYAIRKGGMVPEISDDELYGKSEILDQENYDREMRQADKFKSLRQSQGPTLGLAFVRTINGADALSKLNRYHVTIERSFYLALHELQRVQAARRQGRLVEAPTAVDVTVLGEPVLQQNAALEMPSGQSSD